MKKIILGIISLSIGLFIIFLVLNFHADIPLEKLKEKYTYLNSSFVEVNGMSVHYRKNGSGKPLVLIHGTGASLHTWDRWTALLQDEFTIYSLDIPAFGLTGPHPERDYSIKAYVEFLDAFVQKMDLDSFYLGGNSLGGFISWRYAVTYPEKVEKLILVDPSGMPRDEPLPLGIRLAKYPVTGEALLKVTPKSLFKKSLREVYGDPSKVNKKLVNQYFELFLRPGNRQAYVDRARMDFSGDPAQLSDVKMPTLIQWGEKDEWIKLKYAHQFDELIPNSKLIVYPGAGHVPMEEIPIRTAADVRAFLRN